MEKNMSESFRDRIQIKQNDDILRLQEKYENGLIKEKDISEEDKKKLIELYQKQNGVKCCLSCIEYENNQLNIIKEEKDMEKNTVKK